MWFEKESPPLQSYSPRWNAPRRYNARVRAIIIIGVLLLVVTSRVLLNHYSTPTQTDLHGLKTLEDLDNPEIHQQDKSGSLARPPPTEGGEADFDATNAVRTDIPTAYLPVTPKLANSTLDFGKIYVLNLKTREDRHDEMALIAAASGLQFQYVAGVDSETLDTQSLPDTYGTPDIILRPPHLACFRGHANIWREIVEGGIETALILEDDVDWDLNIREIVPRVKEAMTKITKEPNPFSNTPAWDILYLGTCYEEFWTPDEFDEDESDEYFVQVPSDEEDLDPELYEWVEEIIKNYFDDDVTPRRLIVKGKNPVCTHGYAITQRAARKLLLELNEWLPFPVDITMIHYIDEGRFKAYSVIPPLLVQWRDTEDAMKNSDIEKEGIEETRNWGIVRSARKNVIDWYSLT